MSPDREANGEEGTGVQSPVGLQLVSQSSKGAGQHGRKDKGEILAGTIHFQAREGCCNGKMQGVFFF